MKILQLADAVRYRTMTTEELRETFLIDNLFQPGKIGLIYVDLDRTVIGSAVPTGEALRLPTDNALKASYFLERRELGILNVGAVGSVSVNGARFELNKLDGLYVGRGNDEVVFESADAAQPAEFYLLSYPAHAVYPTQLIRSGEQAKVTLGAAETEPARDYQADSPGRYAQLPTGDGVHAACGRKRVEHHATAYAHEALGGVFLLRRCGRSASDSLDGPRA